MGLFVLNFLNINCVCALCAHIMEVRGQLVGISSLLPCGSRELNLGYQVWQRAPLTFLAFHQPSIFFFKKKVYLTFMVYMWVGAFLRFWGPLESLDLKTVGNMTALLLLLIWQTTFQFYFLKESNRLWAAFSKAHCSRITCLFPDLHSKQAIKFDPALRWN